ncbi:unnamed protein product, partial [Scytosiphon promiscuus]
SIRLFDAPEGTGGCLSRAPRVRWEGKKCLPRSTQRKTTQAEVREPESTGDRQEEFFAVRSRVHRSRERFRPAILPFTRINECPSCVEPARGVRGEYLLLVVVVDLGLGGWLRGVQQWPLHVHQLKRGDHCRSSGVSIRIGEVPERGSGFTADSRIGGREQQKKLLGRRTDFEIGGRGDHRVSFSVVGRRGKQGYMWVRHDCGAVALSSRCFLSLSLCLCPRLGIRVVILLLRASPFLVGIYDLLACTRSHTV